MPWRITAKAGVGNCASGYQNNPPPHGNTIPAILNLSAGVGNPWNRECCDPFPRLPFSAPLFRGVLSAELKNLWIRAAAP